jgi:hypothetical protein
MKSGCSYNDVDKLLWMLFVIVFDMLEAITNAFVMGKIPQNSCNAHFEYPHWQNKLSIYKNIIQTQSI